MKVLVTGATGTVGSKVVKALAEKGVDVRAGVHNPEKARGIKSAHVEPVAFDYNNPATIEAALFGVDKVFLLTPFTQQQVEQSKTVIDLAKKAGVKHIVKLSAMGAEQKNAIQLGRWHKEAEDYLKASGVPYTILRPSMFMDNYATMMADSVKQGAIMLPHGTGRIPLIDTRDIGAVAAEVFTTSGHEGKAYPLTGAKAMTENEAAGTFTKVLGKSVTYVDVPDPAARQGMLGMGLPGWMVDTMMELHQTVRENKMAMVTPDTKRILGRDPISFEQFVKDHKAVFA